MRLEKKQFILSLLVFIFMAAIGPASAFAAISGRAASSFADSLFEEGDYYRAITEYKRIIHDSPQSDLAKEARLKIAIAYIKGKRFDSALLTLEKFRQSYSDDPLVIEAIFLEGEAWFSAGNYKEALKIFQKVGRQPLLPEQKERAISAKGWTLMKMGRWKEASAVFDSLGETEQGRYLRLSLDLDKGERLPRKSPALAGTLSAIIPGAGQLYVGRKRDAFVSFLLNGAFIAGAAEAFRKGEDAIGGILLFFEAGWYTGNIYSAAGGAHKYNDKTRNDFAFAMERKYALGTDGKGKLFGLYHLRF